MFDATLIGIILFLRKIWCSHRWWLPLYMPAWDTLLPVCPRICAINISQVSLLVLLISSMHSHSLMRSNFLEPWCCLIVVMFFHYIKMAQFLSHVLLYELVVLLSDINIYVFMIVFTMMRVAPLRRRSIYRARILHWCAIVSTYLHLCLRIIFDALLCIWCPIAVIATCFLWI